MVVIALSVAAVYIMSIATRSSLVKDWQWQFDDLKHRINQIDLMVYKIHSYHDNGWYIQYDNGKKRRKRKPRRHNRGRRVTTPTDYTYTKDEEEIAARILANGEPLYMPMGMAAESRGLNNYDNT